MPGNKTEMCQYFGGKCECETDDDFNGCAIRYSGEKVVGAKIGGMGPVLGENFDAGFDQNKAFEDSRGWAMEERGIDPTMGEIKED
jgi:hypothetical protein